MKKNAIAVVAIILAVIFIPQARAKDPQQNPSQDSNIPVNRQLSNTSSVANEASGDPFEEMEKMQQSVNSILRESWRRMKNYRQAGKFFEPDADFVDQGNVYVLKMDLPGMQKDQIQIEATENFISVSGERHTERQAAPNKEGVYQFERSSGSFARRMSLPSDANSEQIAAKYENGVLEITIPKTKPQTTEKKKIQVQ